MDTPAPGRRLSLALRIFLLVLGLLVLAIGSAVLVSFGRGSQIADQAVDGALEASSMVQGEIAEQRLQEVQLKVQLIAADAAFVNYINDAQTSGVAVGDPLLTESGSIFDLLVERQDSFGFDLGIVLDPLGNVLARTDQPEAFAEKLADDRFVATAMDTLEPISGYWRHGDHVYQTAIWPLDQGQGLVGFLMVANEVDNALSQRIRRISSAHIAFVLPNDQGVGVLGSSLEPAALAELQDALQHDLGGMTSAVQHGTAITEVALPLGGEQWIARVTPLDPDGGAMVGSAIQLTSADAAEAGYRAILDSLGLTGLLAIVVALPLSLWLTRVSLRPLAVMAHAAKDAAGGHYHTRLDLGGNDELSELGRAFDSLLSDLRGERDIESYVTHLSRLLPEPGVDALPSAPLPASLASRRETLTLIALDTRSRPSDTGNDADSAIAGVGELVSALAELAEETGGHLLGASGSRLLFGFSGSAQRMHALHFAGEVLGNENSLAAAAIEGEVTIGSIQAAGTSLPTATGAAVPQIDRLLNEASPAQLLLPRSLGEAIRQLLGEAAVSVAKGSLSGKPFYAMSIDSLRQLPPLPTGETAASDPSQTTRSPSALQGSATIRRSAGLASGGDLAAGARLGNRFVILSVLGSGGMGVVYKARDIELDDVVALKMLKGEALGDGEQLERLKSEIRLARRITHPNVLRTFDFGDFAGAPYISMEYVRGMTLRFLLQQSGRLPYTAALRIARQLCAGLQAAHEVGVLHRDIKPENLILEASGNAKLMDFGIARPIRRNAPGSTEPGTFVGTPTYSAPEQLAGQDVDHRADIFSCGVLLCEMFCGGLPFAGNNAVELYMAQMQGEPKRPSEWWPEVPAELERIILRCLQRRIDDRYPSATELLQALAGLRA